MKLAVRGCRSSAALLTLAIWPTSPSATPSGDVAAMLKAAESITCNSARWARQ